MTHPLSLGVGGLGQDQARDLDHLAFDQNPHEASNVFVTSIVIQSLLPLLDIWEFWTINYNPKF